jgi:hypothetical protein
MQDDELTLLWKQGTSMEPDAAEISRLAGLASMKRFDRSISARNFGEYVAGLVLLLYFGWNLAVGGSVVFSLMAAGCVLVVLGALWWQHRDLRLLDPSVDAKAFHAAMVARIDKQLHLLGHRFWYLMPLCIPFFWGILSGTSDASANWPRDLALLAALFAAAAWLNENWGVRRLREERARIERLYEE